VSDKYGSDPESTCGSGSTAEVQVNASRGVTRCARLPGLVDVHVLSCSQTDRQTDRQNDDISCGGVVIAVRYCHIGGWFVCRLGSSSLDSIAADDVAAAAAAQRFHLQRLAAAAAAMRYSPYHFSPHPCLSLPGLTRL